MKSASMAVLVATMMMTPALAAEPDQGPIDPEYALPASGSEAYNWSGCYVGAVGGYQWGQSRQRYGGLVNGVPNAFAPVGTDLTGNYNVDGGQIGGTIGCNYQTEQNFVFGIEADGSWVGADGRTLSAPSAVALGANPNFEFTTDQNWMATVRGRAGYAWGRWLGYATGGLVVGGFEVNNQNANPAATVARQSPSDITKIGWTAGAGIEAAIDQHWTFKAEGLYMDYGSMRYGNDPGTVTGCTAGCFNADVSMESWIARIGLNYKF